MAKTPVSGFLTHDELLALGAEIAADDSCHGMEREGRALTNMEMYAFCEWKREERRKAEDFIREEL